MQEALNSFFLNEVANAILFLVLAVLYVNTFFDRKIQGTKRDRDFSTFMLACTLYVGLMLVQLPLAHYGTHEALLFAVSMLRVLAAVLAYSFFAGWLLSVANEKYPVAPSLKRYVAAVTVVLFLLSLILRVSTGSNTAANIPILTFYLLILVITLYYSKALGRAYTIVMVVFVVGDLLLQAQEWWNYTPANIYLVLCTMLVYSRLWLEQKERHLERECVAADQRAQLESARTKLVLSQIKPHFLYNTLSTVAYLCEEDPKQAQKLSIDLTSYLRGNLSALDSGEKVPISEELNHVETYLGIERVRFEDMLDVEYDIQDEGFEVPVLTVEPLVENAVKHGVCQKLEGGTVTIATREGTDCHLVIVSDDGVGFDVSNLDEESGDHVGLRSVRRRVELLSEGTLSVVSDPGIGTTATLRIPKEENQA